MYLEDDLGYLALLHLAAVLLLAPLGNELIDILDCDVDISAASIIMISDMYIMQIIHGGSETVLRAEYVCLNIPWRTLLG